GEMTLVCTTRLAESVAPKALYFLTGGPSSCAANTLRELAHLELVHLVLQRAERDAEVFGGSGDVAAAFFDRPQDEVALEGIGRFLEQALRPVAFGLELREVEFEREVLLRDEVLVAHCHQPLDQVFELADVARPPVALQHHHRGIGDTLNPLAEL